MARKVKSAVVHVETISLRCPACFQQQGIVAIDDYVAELHRRCGHCDSVYRLPILGSYTVNIPLLRGRANPRRLSHGD